MSLRKMQLNESSQVTFDPPLETVFSGGDEEEGYWYISMIKDALIELHKLGKNSPYKALNLPHNAIFKSIPHSPILTLPRDPWTITMTIMTDNYVYFTALCNPTSAQLFTQYSLDLEDPPRSKFSILHRDDAMHRSYTDNEVIAEYSCVRPALSKDTTLKTYIHKPGFFSQPIDVESYLTKRVEVTANRVIEETIADVQGRLADIIKAGAHENAHKLFDKWKALKKMQAKIEDGSLDMDYYVAEALEYGVKMTFQKYYDVGQYVDAKHRVWSIIAPDILNGEKEKAYAILWFAKQYLLRSSTNQIEAFVRSYGRG